MAFSGGAVERGYTVRSLVDVNTGSGQQESHALGEALSGIRTEKRFTVIVNTVDIVSESNGA